MHDEQLHKVGRGRIFVRAARGESRGDDRFAPGADERFKQARLLLGVIEVPKAVEVERTHVVRANAHLWMDVAASRRPRTYMSEADVRECDLGHLLTEMDFASGPLPDCFEVFLRATHLPHDDPRLRWAYIAGALARPVGAMPAEGLYEFDASRAGFTLVSTDIHRGESPSAVLRQPLWGPQGAWGMATSLEPDSFPEWHRAENERNRKRDPQFAEYARRMEERCPATLVYTASQAAERSRIGTEVVRELLAVEHGEEDDRAPAAVMRDRP